MGRKKVTGENTEKQKGNRKQQHPQWNTLPGQRRHALDKPFRCLQCPPDFQLVSKETCCVPESIHQIRPERKQCENPQLSLETCRQVITEKVSLALQHWGSSTQQPPWRAALPSIPPTLSFSPHRLGLRGRKWEFNLDVYKYRKATYSI